VVGLGAGTDVVWVDRLLLNIHINCDPFESVPPVRFARLWSDVGASLAPEGLRVDAPHPRATIAPSASC
jgi:hypothetical protein